VFSKITEEKKKKAMLPRLVAPIVAFLALSGCITGAPETDGPAPSEPGHGIHVGLVTPPVSTAPDKPSNKPQPVVKCDSAHFQACDHLVFECTPGTECYAFKLCYINAVGKDEVRACVDQHPDGSIWWSAIVNCECECDWDPPSETCDGSQYGKPE
jgi:hypothetical protein